MLYGRAYQFQWGTRRELVDVRRYLEYKHNETYARAYGRLYIFGVTVDSKLPEGLWLFVRVSEHSPVDKNGSIGQAERQAPEGGQ